MKNSWGIYPTEYKVLIEPDEMAEVAGREKILFIPDNVRDKLSIAKVKGVLIAIGGNSFDDWKEPIPKVGDKVYFAKYAGIRLVKEADRTKVAVLCNDKDICAILDPDIEEIDG